ncbi:MAG: ribonuclease P protein component [Bacteroidales bacterium]|nr:ribonuclease P protein component [Bacteroidales bacterium]
METFGKDERLSSKKAIEQLFLNGRNFKESPFKVYWIISEWEQKSPAQVLITVPKRSFKSAVDRNLIKRTIREAYRRKKQFLYDNLLENNLQIVFVFIYVGKKHLDYTKAEEKIMLILQRLVTEINEHNC